jgi:hypothetical protein
MQELLLYYIHQVRKSTHELLYYLTSIIYPDFQTHACLPLLVVASGLSIPASAS